MTIHTNIPFSQSDKPSREEVEAAFRTIIRWSGDNPDRPGLQETPSRAARAFEEYFSGYHQDPIQILSKTFDETGGYQEMVILRGFLSRATVSIILLPLLGARGSLMFRSDASSASRNWRASLRPTRNAFRYRSG